MDVDEHTSPATAEDAPGGADLHSGDAPVQPEASGEEAMSDVEAASATPEEAVPPPPLEPPPSPMDVDEHAPVAAGDAPGGEEALGEGEASSDVDVETTSTASTEEAIPPPPLESPPSPPLISDENDGDPEFEPVSGSSPDELLLVAITCKEEGNTAFQVGDFSSATRHYRKGVNQLKKLNEGNTGEEQVKQLLITLHTNLSMVLFKQKKNKFARDAASKAIDIDPSHVKALYRRGVAFRAMGDVDAAKVDLKKAYKLDPSNTAVKTELVAIKKALEELLQDEQQDEQLYGQGQERPEGDFCPICTLPIPLPMHHNSIFTSCCMKRVCYGCDAAAKIRCMADCPFCRTPYPNHPDAFMARVQARVKKKDPVAINNLGEDYQYERHGVKKDMQKAVELWTEAAELGSIRALYNLGYYYGAEGEVHEDKEKAYTFYKKAAMQGDAESRHNLGCFEGQKGNLDRALRHFLISAKMGYNHSIDSIKGMFLRGDATKDLYAEALKGYQDASEEMKSHERDGARAILKACGQLW